ncbi:MAG: hypothetical protein MJ252_00290 [archaeon]|nr:hypothetical protein [archaeon]
MQVRHGLMIVGGAGGGKSTNWKILQKSISDLADGEKFFTTETRIMNPKSIKKGELFCEKDPMNPTEWINGIIPNIVNELNSYSKEKKKFWILFDGPVDTFWIEDMNSVLDDSRKLCLPSSAIIVLNESITMMFEVEDLQHASPATVSRCGMVYMEPASMGLMPMVKTWLDTKLPKFFLEVVDKFSVKGFLEDLFSYSLEENVRFVRKNIKEPCPTTDVGLTHSLLTLLECMLLNLAKTRDNKPLEDHDEIKNFCEKIHNYYFFATIWTIGITGKEDGREKFNKYILEFWEGYIKNKSTEFEMEFNLKVDEGCTVYDYFFTFDFIEIKWNKWETKLEEPKIDLSAEYTDIIIPTIDSTRYNYIMRELLVKKRNTLITGPTGTGKTVNFKKLITSLENEKKLDDKFSSLTINFSAQTTAAQTQGNIEKMLIRKRIGRYAPENNKVMIVFVDDTNMPKKEIFDAQPPIEILRQWLDYEGWYDLVEKGKPFKFILNIFLTGAMGYAGGGRSVLTNRFMRHFNLIAFTELSDESIKKIFVRKVKHFLAKFPVDIQGLIPSIVNCTLSNYKDIKEKMLPLPKSSHYLFNLRDMSKVLQGVCSASLKHTERIVDIVRLWYHEMQRCFGDRLICEEDRQWLKELLNKTVLETKDFRFEMIEELYDGLDEKLNNNIIFCDFVSTADKPYTLVTRIKTFIEKIEDGLAQFNDEYKNKNMPLVMFLNACEHVARISRILRQSQGNALLLGVGGSGRQSIARLASYMNFQLDCYQIEVIKGYRITDFRTNIKDFLKATVVAPEGASANQPTCFLLCDTQLFDEVMLEDMNNILNSGDIPNIYKAEDIEQIKKAVHADVIGAGLIDNINNNMYIYIKKVQSKIHIILAMSPVGEQFVTRLRMFPSLVNCCTIDWFTEWPEEALMSVAKDKLEKNEDIYLGQKEAFNAIVETIKYIHKSVEKISVRYLAELRRYNYLTPTSFLEFLNLFQDILVKKTKENEDNIIRYDTGLKVLQFAEENIAIIDKEIQIKTPELEKLSADTEKIIKEVEEKKKIADAVREQASKDSQAAEKLALQISKTEAECAADLAQATAELNVNLKKIDAISDQSLAEVANYKNYGPALCEALEVLLLFKCGNAFKNKKANQEPTGDPKNPFKLSYRAAAVNDLTITDPKKFKEYFQDCKNEDRRETLKNKEMDKVVMAEDFIAAKGLDSAKVDNASKAITPCFEFVKGMISYCHTAINIVDPKKKIAEAAKKDKAEAEEKLAKANAELAKAEKESQELEARLNEKQRERNALIVQLNDNQSKLKRARKIVELLSSEKLRWADNVSKLKENAKNITGDCLIGAAGIAYLGPFISNYRKELEDLWRQKLDDQKIIRSPEASLRFVLEDKIESGKWNKNGLPNDNLSIENGIIMFRTRKWPLMIDPQNQASIFLKKYGIDKRATSFQCIKISDPKMIDTVISGVKYGSWIMLDNVQLTLDNALEPILQRQQVKSSISNFYEIKIGDKVIPYNEEFGLFMVTTLSNPHYSPETFAKITIINFAITEKGLEDQMLSELVQIEKPQLEVRKNKIIAENFENQEKLRDTEDQILKNLSDNKDHIEDTLKSNDLIDILQEAKENSTRINEEMKKSEEASIEINQSREIYRPSAKRASLLFFSLIDLAIIDPMYQFSLIQFKTLYAKTVKATPPCEDMEKRLTDINSSTTKTLYDFTCRSLFEKDKQLFSFLMATKIIMGEQEGTSKIKPTELRFLLAGPSADIEITPPENPTTWISPNDWNSFYLQLYGMQTLDETMKDTAEQFMKNHQKWYEFFDSPKNEHTPLPDPFEDRLTPFQKLILVKAIRFDKLTNEIIYYVENNLGKEYTEPPTFNLTKSYEDSNYTIPLLFVLSTGSDPKNDFQNLADSMQVPTDYVSLGKSMDKIALNKIEKMKEEGGWILLQNCHLGISFMPKLEDEIEKLESNPPAKDTFRLWLTSMSSDQFSIGVLKSSIKITMEPPKGLKLNLQRQYENIPEEELEGCTKKDLFKSFFFALCFFHAIVQDRRKFGPIGWNIKYDFTNEDLLVSRMQLKNFLEEYDYVPYKVLNYLVAEINYGGRVTDDKDQRLIMTILKTYLCEDTLKTKDYKYSSSGIYYCPQIGCKADYLAYIKNLPLGSAPEVFGLHDNAEIITAQNDARLLLETLLSMQPRSSGAGGKTADQIVMETLKNIEGKTPPLFDYEAIFKKYPTKYEESMNTVLVQEVIKYNVLLNLMKVNMANVEKALTGRIVMNDELESIVNCFYNNLVPKKWIDKGFLSMKPLMSWVADLNERINFFKDWYEKGTPVCFALSKFSFPQAFITGTLQNFARKHKCEIDLLSFEFKVLDDLTPDKVTERPEDGAYVYGMFLEGAKWSYEKHVVDTSLNRELYTNVPLIHMLPVKNRKPPETGIYHAPLYKVLSRQGTLSTTGHSTNFVLMVELPSKEDESVWIKAGVAMFLALKQ